MKERHRYSLLVIGEVASFYLAGFIYRFTPAFEISHIRFDPKLIGMNTRDLFSIWAGVIIWNFLSGYILLLLFHPLLRDKLGPVNTISALVITQAFFFFIVSGEDGLVASILLISVLPNFLAFLTVVCIRPPKKVKMMTA